MQSREPSIKIIYKNSEDKGILKNDQDFRGKDLISKKIYEKEILVDKLDFETDQNPSCMRKRLFFVVNPLVLMSFRLVPRVIYRGCE